MLYCLCVEYLKLNKTMITDTQFIKALSVIKAYKEQLNKTIEDADCFDIKVTETGLSVRCLNALNDYLHYYHSDKRIYNLRVSDLSLVSISKFKKLKRVGYKTIELLKSVCDEYGIELKK